MFLNQSRFESRANKIAATLAEISHQGYLQLIGEY